MSVFSKIMSFFGYVKYKDFSNYVKRELLESQMAKNADLIAQNVDLSFKNSLVAQLLGDKGHNEALQKFKTLLYGEFFAFANNDDSLSNEAEAVSIMQSIEKELEVISTASQLYNKEIVAVGGGFSAGKSQFISSLILDNNVRLPIGIAPTTAIPTYVLSSEETKLVAFSNSGVRVELNELDSEIHSKINHDFIKGFGFNLKKIMPFMVLKTTLESRYENLCFIDTPGYNPSKDGFRDSDRYSAQEFLNNANAMLWLIGLDSKGTIEKDDIDFLSELDLSSKKLYVVLNKADVPSPSQRKAVFEQIKKQLNAYGIEYDGISTYSATKHEEYEFEKISLMEFLDSLTQSHTLQTMLIKRLFSVYAMYVESNLHKKKRKDTIYKALNELELALSVEDLDDDSQHFERIAKIKSIFKVGNETKEQIAKLTKIIVEMKNAIDEIFGKVLKIHLPQIDENDIKIDFDLAVEEFIEENDESSENKKDILRFVLKAEPEIPTYEQLVQDIHPIKIDLSTEIRNSLNIFRERNLSIPELKYKKKT
ncbi:dynamin family protein [Helicobacter sp. T3_23-1059]